jgi:hypothetical protein
MARTMHSIFHQFGFFASSGSLYNIFKSLPSHWHVFMFFNPDVSGLIALQAIITTALRWHEADNGNCFATVVEDRLGDLEWTLTPCENGARSVFS